MPRSGTPMFTDQRTEIAFRSRFFVPLVWFSLVVTAILLVHAVYTGGSVPRTLAFLSAIVLEGLVLFLLRSGHYRLAALLFNLFIIIASSQIELLQYGPMSKTLVYPALLMIIVFFMVPTFVMKKTDIILLCLAALYITFRHFSEQNLPLMPSDMGIAAYGLLAVVLITVLGGSIMTRIMFEQIVKKLLERENAYRALFEKSPFPILLLDAMRRIIDNNDPFLDSFGYTRSQIIGKSIDELRLIRPEDNPGQEETFCLTGDMEHVEIVTRDCEDHIHFSLLSAKTLLLNNQCIMLLIFNDITKQKAVEDDLRYKEKKYKEIVDSFVDIYYQTDPEGTIRVMTPSSYALTGWTAEELIGQSIHILYADPSERERLLAQIRAEGIVNGFETIMRKKDGTEAVASVNARFLFDADGVWDGVVGSIRDITERKQVEEEIRRNEAMYRTIFEYTGTASMLIRQDTIITLVNEEFVRLSGYSREELENHLSWTSLVVEEDLKKMLTYHKQRRAKETADSVPTVYDFRLITKTGELRDILIHVGIIPNTSMSVASLLDITDRKLAEMELREHERMINMQMSLILSLMLDGSVFDGHFEQALRIITESCAEITNTERVSVWLYNEDYSSILCIDLYENSAKRHSQNYVLRSADFPSYTASHLKGNLIAAYDVEADPLTCEIPKDYITEHDIRSLMDVPLWLHGKVGGILSFEHTRNHRHWTMDEERLAVMMATLITLSYEAKQRKEMEEELRQSEARFSRVFQSKLLIVSISRLPDTCLIDINETFERILGYRKDEVIGKTAFDLGLFPPSVTAGTFESMVAKEKRISILESPYFTKSGEQRTGLLTAEIVKIQGETCLLTIALDITDKKKIEQALSQREVQLQAITHNLPGVVYQVYARPNGETGLYYVSDRSRILFDIPDDPAIALDVFQKRITAKDFPVFIKTFKEARDSLTPWSFDGCFQKENGQEVWFRILSIPIKTDNEILFNGMILDITEQKLLEIEREKAQEAMRQSEIKYRMLAENAADVIWTMDLSQKLNYVSPSAERMHGWPQADWLNMRMEDYITPASMQQILGLMKAELDRVSKYGPDPDRIINLEAEMYRFDGSTFQAEVSVRWILDEQGHPTGMIGITRDISERLRLQELMIQSEKMTTVAGLAAGMAHEINNPLGIIMQGAENATRRLLSDIDPNRQAAASLGIRLDLIQSYIRDRKIDIYLKGIRDAAERAARIVSNMLQFSRKTESRIQHLNINELIDNAIELASNDYDLDKRYDFRRIELIKDYADVPLIPCTETELEQVFFNIFKNSAQAMVEKEYTDAGPSISIMTRQHEDYLVVEIKDNGPGIPDAERKRIFEPFYTSKGPGAGTGLGLSVSYYIIVNNHQGQISVDSEAGEWTRFTIWLPIERRKEY